MPFVWLNGNFVDESTAAIPLRDPGLLHGLGVFTTMRSYGGRVFRLDQHLARLRESCEALSIRPPDEQVGSGVAELLVRNDFTDARLRLTITPANQFLTAGALEPYPAAFYQRGITVVLVDEHKLNPFDPASGHKTFNYLGRLSALRAAGKQQAGEALWFDVHNYLQSGSISNVFIVKDNELFTPPTPREMRESVNPDSIPYPKSAVLPGITRQTVIELARAASIDVRLSGIDVNMLLDADEVFLTNSIMEVMPVCRIERKAVANDRPGPMTRLLAERYQRLIMGSQ
jgi:branched-chain amino acid aminotransferase